MREYTIGTGIVNGYRITRPIKVMGFRVDSARPPFQLQYLFEGLPNGECICVAGHDYSDAKQKMRASLVELYNYLIKDGAADAVDDNQRRVNELARDELGTFLIPIC